MSGQRICIAGYFKDNTCVRPVDSYGRINIDWIKDSNEAIIHPFADVELNFENRTPCEKPHTEDWPVSMSHRVKVGTLNRNEQIRLLSKINDVRVDNIFKAPIHKSPTGRYVLKGDGDRSLGTICLPEIIDVICDTRYDKLGYRLAFMDGAHTKYELKVTDLAFNYFMNYVYKNKIKDLRELSEFAKKKLMEADVYLRIGLTRGWDPDQTRPQNKCWLQITGVYSFPDYLEGGTFLNYE
jgi:hypothetical protein